MLTRTTLHNGWHRSRSSRIKADIQAVRSDVKCRLVKAKVLAEGDKAADFFLRRRDWVRIANRLKLSLKALYRLRRWILPYPIISIAT